MEKLEYICISIIRRDTLNSSLNDLRNLILNVMENEFKHAIILLLRGISNDDQTSLSQQGIHDVLTSINFINQKLSRYDKITQFHILLPKSIQDKEFKSTIEEQCVELIVQELYLQPKSFSKEEWLNIGSQKPQYIAEQIYNAGKDKELVMVIENYHLLEEVFPKLINPEKSSGLGLLVDKSNKETLTHIVEKIDFKHTTKVVIIFFDNKNVVHGIYSFPFH